MRHAWPLSLGHVAKEMRSSVRNRRRFSTVRLVLALAVAAGTFGAIATSGVAPDDEIPGAPIPASPFSGSLIETDNPYALDVDDVYAISLSFNNRLDVTVTVPSAGDFDAYLFAPGAKSVARALQPPYTQLLAYSGRREAGATETFTYVSDSVETTTCFLAVRAWAGSGPYEVKWALTTLPSPAVTASAPTTVAYRGSALITGTVAPSGTAQGVSTVEVLASPSGESGWTRVATGTVAPLGTFSLSVSPRRATRYQVRSLPAPAAGASAGYGYGPVLTVTPKAYLSIAHTPSRAIRGRAFTVKGFLKPSHAATTRHVHVVAYRRNPSGTWVYKQTFRARGSGYRWAGSVKLLTSGRWRLKAMVRTDSLHAKTYSAWHYVRVP